MVKAPGLLSAKFDRGACCCSKGVPGLCVLFERWLEIGSGPERAGSSTGSLYLGDVHEVASSAHG
jgi:hypothetical protein